MNQRKSLERFVSASSDLYHSQHRALTICYEREASHKSNAGISVLTDAFKEEYLIGKAITVPTVPEQRLWL